VVVGEDNILRSTGYNGLVRKVEALPGRLIRPEKYHWMEHAERNAIYNAAQAGVSLKNGTLYTNGLPCVECARAIIQSGILCVVTDKVWEEADNREEWKESFKRTRLMFDEAGVGHSSYAFVLQPVMRFQRGKEL
jgi:dCMP deaminase